MHVVEAKTLHMGRSELHGVINKKKKEINKPKVHRRVLFFFFPSLPTILVTRQEENFHVQQVTQPNGAKKKSEFSFLLS